MKDLLEPLIYPHNLVLLGLLLACIGYRKKGLWFLLIFYYLAGNSFIANQVRSAYSAVIDNSAVVAGSQLLVLGCGGSATALPACAKARLSDAVSRVNGPAALLISTEYCQPYVDYLLGISQQVVVDCFNGGGNTYQEFATIKAKGLTPDYILSSDYHAWRVQQLVRYHGLPSKVLASSSQTFRPVNCSYNCFFTVNLSNFDLYSKLTAEFSSYAVFVLTRDWTTWYSAAEQGNS